MKLTTAQNDWACGVLLATAGGDALGTPYEFEPALGPELPVEMVGGGGFGWEPGEWTDDTSMAIVNAEVAATEADLQGAQDSVARRGGPLGKGKTDTGIQIRYVLSPVGRPGPQLRRTRAPALDGSSM